MTSDIGIDIGIGIGTGIWVWHWLNFSVFCSLGIVATFCSQRDLGVFSGGIGGGYSGLSQTYGHSVFLVRIRHGAVFGAFDCPCHGWAGGVADAGHGGGMFCQVGSGGLGPEHEGVYGLPPLGSAQKSQVHLS